MTTTVTWLDIVFGIAMCICALCAIFVFIEWNIYRAFEYKRYKEHLKKVEDYIKKEKENNNE